MRENTTQDDSIQDAQHNNIVYKGCGIQLVDGPPVVQCPLNYCRDRPPVRIFWHDRTL